MTQAVKQEAAEPQQTATASLPEKQEIKAAPASKPAASTRRKAEPKAKAVTANPPSASHLKNPATGEIIKVPHSYAFAKRWIKEALVNEGLLDKVYKNNELDAATSANIQNALGQLCALDKYRAD
jgi:hypothetical protein